MRHLRVQGQVSTAARDSGHGGRAMQHLPRSPKFWGVTWNKVKRRWVAHYTDADGKRRYIGHFNTQEKAAHAVNAAIRRAGLEGRRKTNPVVDGQLVPKPSRKRPRVEDPAAAPPRRSARRSRQE